MPSSWICRDCKLATALPAERCRHCGTAVPEDQNERVRSRNEARRRSAAPCATCGKANASWFASPWWACGTCGARYCGRCKEATIDREREVQGCLRCGAETEWFHWLRPPKLRCAACGRPLVSFLELITMPSRERWRDWDDSGSVRCDACRERTCADCVTQIMRVGSGLFGVGRWTCRACGHLDNVVREPSLRWLE